jgi:hypothetical protein
MLVIYCKMCPFFHETVVSLLMSDGRGGVCAYDREIDAVVRPGLKIPAKELAPLLDRRRRVEDPMSIPEWCPLRDSPVVVSLGG